MSSDPQVPHSHKGEHHGSTDDEYIELTRSARIYALCAAINSCNLGYDIGVSTNVGPLLQDDFNLTNEEREILIGALNLFSMFGGLTSQFFSDRYGRRTTFFVASILVLISRIVMSVSTSYWLLMVGRAVIGIGIGVGFAVCI